MPSLPVGRWLPEGELPRSGCVRKTLLDRNNRPVSRCVTTLWDNAGLQACDRILTVFATESIEGRCGSITDPGTATQSFWGPTTKSLVRDWSRVSAGMKDGTWLVPCTGSWGMESSSDRACCLGKQGEAPNGSWIACWLKELAGVKTKSKIGGAIEFEEEFVWCAGGRGIAGCDCQKALGFVATLEDRQADVGVRRGDGLQAKLGQKPLGHRPGVSGSSGQFHPLKLVFGIKIVS